MSAIGWEFLIKRFSNSRSVPLNKFVHLFNMLLDEAASNLLQWPGSFSFLHFFKCLYNFMIARIKRHCFFLTCQRLLLSAEPVQDIRFGVHRAGDPEPLSLPGNSFFTPFQRLVQHTGIISALEKRPGPIIVGSLSDPVIIAGSSGNQVSCTIRLLLSVSIQVPDHG